MRIIEIFIEVFYWIRIVASPLLIGIGIGILIYSTNPNIIGMTTGIIVSCIGLLLGILWATKVWRKTGTSNFISKINASPELNKKNN